MQISYDPEKRALVLANRGLDFDDVPEAFAGPHYDRIDDRFDYGETLWLTVGVVKSRLVVIVWTGRGDTRHIITMWKANADEQELYTRAMDRPRSGPAAH